MPNQPPPRNAGRAAVFVVATIIAIAVIAFVGMNLSHRKSVVQQEQGQRASDPAAQPKGPHDLQTEPQQK